MNLKTPLLRGFLLTSVAIFEPMSKSNTLDLPELDFKRIHVDYLLLPAWCY